MKGQERLLLISIILHHLYITFLNTSSVHGLVVLDKLVWTGLLSLFIVALTYFYLKEPAESWYERSLYLAIILSLAGSFLRAFGFSVQIFSYALMLVMIVILTTIPLIVHHHNQLRVMLLAIYTLEFIVLLTRVFDIAGVIPTLGPIVELAIVVGVLYYNYSLGFMYDELFIIILVTFIGWQLGAFIADLSSDVPALIVSTMFEQMLSVGQFTFKLGFMRFNATFFLSLHVALIFNLIIVQILARRSALAAAIILTGIDMSYPPIMALRAIAILAFLRSSMKDTTNNNAEEMDDKPEPVSSDSD